MDTAAEETETDDLVDDLSLEDEDLDELDLDDEGGDETEETSSASASPSKSDRARRNFMKKGAEKAIEIVTATSDNPTAVKVAAAALNSDETDPARMAVDALTAHGRIPTAISDLLTLAEADPFEAGAIAMGLGKPALRQAWSVLEAAGAVNDKLPSKDLEAAKAISKVCASLSADQRAAIDAAIAVCAK